MSLVRRTSDYWPLPDVATEWRIPLPVLESLVAKKIVRSEVDDDGRPRIFYGDVARGAAPYFDQIQRIRKEQRAGSETVELDERKLLFGPHETWLTLADVVVELDRSFAKKYHLKTVHRLLANGTFKSAVAKDADGQVWLSKRHLSRIFGNRNVRTELNAVEAAVVAEERDELRAKKSHDEILQECEEDRAAYERNLRERLAGKRDDRATDNGEGESPATPPREPTAIEMRERLRQVSAEKLRARITRKA